jgi:hypothetical protein
VLRHSLISAAASTSTAEPVRWTAYEFNPLFFTSITKAGNNVRLCWFDTLAGMQLQAAASLINPMWTNVPFAPGTNRIELPLGSGPAFFQLLTP